MSTRQIYIHVTMFTIGVLIGLMILMISPKISKLVGSTIKGDIRNNPKDVIYFPPENTANKYISTNYIIEIEYISSNSDSTGLRRKVVLNVRSEKFSSYRITINSSNNDDDLEVEDTPSKFENNDDGLEMEDNSSHFISTTTINEIKGGNNDGLEMEDKSIHYISTTAKNEIKASNNDDLEMEDKLSHSTTAKNKNKCGNDYGLQMEDK